MSAILNSLNAHNFPIFQPILMKLVSKSMIYRAISFERDTYHKGCGPFLNLEKIVKDQPLHLLSFQF